MTGPPDLGLQTGEEIKFAAKFPDRGSAVTRLGDGGFRLTFDVPEEESKAMGRLWGLIQTSFEVHVDPPAGEEAAFMASFPTRGGAINRHGDGGARLTLDVAEDEFAPMVLVMAMIQKTLRLRVGPRLGALPVKDGEGAPPRE